MLTARRAFEGDDVSDTLANVLKSQPDWSALPPNLPPAIGVVIKRCLEKDRTRRVADAATVAFVLEEAASLTATAGSASARHRIAQSRGGAEASGRAWPCRAAGGGVSGFVFWRLAPPTPAPQVVRLTMPLSVDGVGGCADGPAHDRYIAGGHSLRLRRPGPALSARGFSIRCPGRAGHERRSGRPHTRVLTGRPVVGFFFSADRTIKRVAVDGGAAVTVCGVDVVFGMTWHGSEIIVGRGRGGIARCPPPAAPWNKSRLSKTVKRRMDRRCSPGVTRFCYHWHAGRRAQQWDSARWDRARIVVQSRSSGARRTLIEGGSDARYVPTGHILYAIGGVVFAVPFDAARQEVTGPAIPVVEGVRRTVAGTTGAAQFAVSHTGNLVYLPRARHAADGRVLNRSSHARRRSRTAARSARSIHTCPSLARRHSHRRGQRRWKGGRHLDLPRWRNGRRCSGSRWRGGTSIPLGTGRQSACVSIGSPWRPCHLPAASRRQSRSASDEPQASPRRTSPSRGHPMVATSSSRSRAVRRSRSMHFRSLMARFFHWAWSQVSQSTRCSLPTAAGSRTAPP